MKSASAAKHQKQTLFGFHSTSTLDLMEKLSQAFATPVEERLLDGDVMSELNRMSLPAELLRTKKLDDLKYFNSCGDDLFKDDILLNEDIEKQFANLPSFLARKVFDKEVNCISCEKLLAKLLDQSIQVEDLDNRLKNSENTITII